MQLFHGNQLIGNINDVGLDQPWNSGTIVLAETLPGIYMDLFRFLTDDAQGIDPPFSSDLLSPENWFVVDRDGGRHGVEVPAIYGDGTIMFRYR